MADLSTMRKVNIEDWYNNSAEDGFLLEDGRLVLIDHIARHMDGTTYMGGGFDVGIESDETYRFIPNNGYVYMLPVPDLADHK